MGESGDESSSKKIDSQEIMPKPDSIIIDSSEVISLEPTQTVLPVMKTKGPDRYLKGLIGVSLFFGAFILLFFFGDDTCYFSLIMFVVGWALLLQAFTTSSELKFSESLGYGVTAIIIIAIIGFTILMMILSSIGG